jgi:hypothetical protein
MKFRYEQPICIKNYHLSILLRLSISIIRNHYMLLAYLMTLEEFTGVQLLLPLLRQKQLPSSRIER